MSTQEITHQDYLTYVSEAESQYFTALTEYITNFVNNFPVFPDATE